MRETNEKGIFWKWGHLMFRFRWLVLSFWLLLFVSLSFLAFQTPSLLKDNGFTPHGSESEIALEQLRADLDYSSSQLQLIYESDSFDLTRTVHQQSILSSLEEVRKLSYVGEIDYIQAIRTTENKGVIAVNVPLQLSTDEALQAYPSVKELIEAPDNMKVHITGGTAVLYDMQEASKKDIIKAEMIGLPIALIVLLFIFGT